MLRLARNSYASCSKSGPLLILLSLAASIFGGCAASGPMPASDKFVVSKKAAQFYKYGPAQAFGPDFNLSEGQKVTMLQRQFGYSRIMLEDGTSGYVATEDLTPAPPEPVARPTPKARWARGSGASSKPRQSTFESIPTDPLFDVNDVPVPLPDEEPATKPQQAAPDVRFRY